MKIILNELEITQYKFDIIEMSGYLFEVNIDREHNKSNVRIILESSIRKPSLTFTDHVNHSVDVTDSVLSMVKKFRTKMGNQ